MKYTHIIASLFFGIGLLGCANTNEKEHVSTEGLKPVEMVYPQLDTENSRWFLFSSACRPFGMVNLSPDTQTGGAWGSGYRYLTDTIKGFSHIHAWQLSGVSVMPVTLGDDNEKEIFTNYESKFSHETEIVAPGYHYLELDRYKIKTELSSTKRVGFHKYNFPKDKKAGILFNLHGELGPSKMIEGDLQKVDSKTLIGSVLNAPTSRRPKPARVFFRVDLNTEIASLVRDVNSGNYLLTLKETTQDVLMKVGLSYTSYDNAQLNIESELAHWDFDKVVVDSKLEWNQLLGRIRVEGASENAQRRFYTDLWHALQGRRIISDVNGAYPDNTGEKMRIGQLPLDDKGNPQFNHYNSDSFWGAQWTINSLWGLVYPEIMEEFVHSMMQMYKDGGLIPRGPSGGNYTYVMTGASSTPFIVSAIQKGIITDDLDAIYAALKKNHMSGGIMAKSGYEHHSAKGGGFEYYLKKGYVPHPNPDGRFGLHQDGASLTMEYAYQDWTLAQLAKRLGHQEDYAYFMKRSENYKNTFDAESGWMRPRDVNGKWRKNFDPYQYENGFNESNGAQSTWFVPHDLAGLAQLMGGMDKAVEKLNAQFETAQEIGFTSGLSHDRELHPEYRRIPVNFGNQPSMQTSQVFNFLERPDLSQYWTRKVLNAAFSGLSPATGYNGDEDQGLMGSLAVLLKIGLFQMNGGTEENPEYQLGSPIFDKVTIELNPTYYAGKTFVIETVNNADDHYYISAAKLNGKVLSNLKLQHADIIKGGKLELELSSTSN